MLRFLQIRDYAIVDSLDLDVSAGFTCITGETGAGKSILVGALGLLCGERADSSASPRRCRQGRTQRRIHTDPRRSGPGLVARRRTGRPGFVPAAPHDRVERPLAGLDQRHGRHACSNWRNWAACWSRFMGRTSTSAWCTALSNFACSTAAAVTTRNCCRCGSGSRTWQALESERRSLLDEKPLDAGDRDLLQYQLQELENDMLPPEEFAELETEHRMLARGSEIVETLEFGVAGSGR